jgi:DNA-directed RNA polymerase specialized sigma24 family protein
VKVDAVDAGVEFTLFVADVEPRLRRALVALRGREDGRDATAEALAWAWEHWTEVQLMPNPVGYLYRVGQSRSRPRRLLRTERVSVHHDPEFEPALGPALRRLPERQRTAVILVHGCHWTYEEVADTLGVSKSSVGTHVARAMAQLRNELEVQHHG